MTTKEREAYFKSALEFLHQIWAHRESGMVIDNLSPYYNFVYLLERDDYVYSRYFSNRIGRGTPETVYYLTDKGLEYVKQRGWDKA